MQPARILALFSDMNDGGLLMDKIIASLDDAPAGAERFPTRIRSFGQLSEPLRIIFLSRISPKKNLGYALRALSQVEAPVAFSIYGPPEDATYQAECERLAAQLPPHVQVRWFGPVDPADVPRVMAEHDLFFLPTRGENFGHVVAEALGAGTPVLLSDTTPWRGLAQLGIGDDLPLAEPAAFVAAIERTAAQSAQEAMARRERASTYARQRHQNMADIEANRQLFAMALKKR